MLLVHTRCNSMIMVRLLHSMQLFSISQILPVNVGYCVCFCYQTMLCFDLAGAVQNLHAVVEGQAVLNTFLKICKIFC